MKLQLYKSRKRVPEKCHNARLKSWANVRKCFNHSGLCRLVTANAHDLVPLSQKLLILSKMHHLSQISSEHTLVAIRYVWGNSFYITSINKLICLLLKVYNLLPSIYPYVWDGIKVPCQVLLIYIYFSSCWSKQSYPQICDGKEIS